MRREPSPRPTTAALMLCFPTLTLNTRSVTVGWISPTGHESAGITITNPTRKLGNQIWPHPMRSVAQQPNTKMRNKKKKHENASQRNTEPWNIPLGLNGSLAWERTLRRTSPRSATEDGSLSNARTGCRTTPAPPSARRGWVLLFLFGDLFWQPF